MTAPTKLQEQHITTLHEMLDTHLNEPQSKEAKALKAAIAALAPPSGEGVDAGLLLRDPRNFRSVAWEHQCSGVVL